MPEPAKTCQEIPFRLVHTRTGETVALLEFPENPTQPGEVDTTFLGSVIDEGMKLNVEYGHEYTIVPMEDLASEMLHSVYHTFKTLDEPTRYVYVLQQRQDGLVNAVERLFSQHERVLIGSKDELADYIAFQRGKAKKYQPRSAKRYIMGKLVAFIAAHGPAPSGDDEATLLGVDPSDVGH